MELVSSDILEAVSTFSMLSAEGTVSGDTHYTDPRQLIVSKHWIQIPYWRSWSPEETSFYMAAVNVSHHQIIFALSFANQKPLQNSHDTRLSSAMLCIIL
jgi:hypothetical protein